MIVNVLMIIIAWMYFEVDCTLQCSVVLAVSVCMLSVVCFFLINRKKKLLKEN